MSVDADPLDQAGVLTQQLNDAYVASVRVRALPQQVQAADGSWPHPLCVDCDADIPPPRLALGRIRCVHCQEYVERSGGRR